MRNAVKTLMPILAAIYGTALIMLTAMPFGNGQQTIWSEVASWLLTLLCIALTLFLVIRLEPKVFPDARRFTFKKPPLYIIVGLLLMVPLWFVVQEYSVFGLSSLMGKVRLEQLTFTPEEFREDMLSSVHAVLLAPVLEELCFRQLPISPFRRRGAQVAVCVVMAVLFAILHVRNAPGAFLAAMFYGIVYILSKNIWYSIILHIGHNLTVTLIGFYCLLGLGDLKISKMPNIIMPDAKIIVVSMFFAIIGLLLIKTKQQKG